MSNKVIVDARGLSCPMPVIKTKKALEEIESGELEVLVSDSTPRENVLKFAKSAGCVAEVVKDEADDIVIKIVKGEGSDLEKADSNLLVEGCSTEYKEVIVITKDTLGEGERELGEILMKGFLFTLTESDPLPKSVILMNSGVKLSTKTKAAIENLKILEEKGVEILSCGTCLDYYNLKEDLQVGTVSNMYTIVENMKEATKVITLG